MHPSQTRQKWRPSSSSRDCGTRPLWKVKRGKWLFGGGGRIKFSMRHVIDGDQYLAVAVAGPTRMYSALW
ncbi:hypothetical protein L484_021345 [Morus notabilis]|uniref:Uncharacterized protein n=1 Tax=Morus notabilis TaxID=981085 RepID=W9SG95_9ROSA|nr:hypothetical protein L484_021345 [Morus notabilis]